MGFDFLVIDALASFRRIRRHRRHFLQLALILAVGFGCILGSFDIAYRMLHLPLACPNPDRVVVSNGSFGRNLFYSYDLPNPRLGTVFESAAEYRFQDANLNTGQGPRRIHLAVVSPQFFSTLGIEIRDGRDFFKTDYYPDPAHQAKWLPIILSRGLWHTYFGSNRAILNHSVTLSTPPYHFEVVGIAPAGATFPWGVDAWVPVSTQFLPIVESAGVSPFSEGVVGRLKQGMSIAAASGIVRSWPAKWIFDSGRDGPVQLVSLRKFLAGATYPLSRKLWLATILFLFLTIVSAIAAIQADIESRGEEFAVRSALGAPAGRLFASLGFETASVVVLGTVASFTVRFALVHLAAGYLSLPGQIDLRVGWIDIAIAAAATAIALVAALIVQAMNLRRLVPVPSIRQRLSHGSEKKSNASRDVMRNRIPIQTIPAAMILILAGLLAHGAWKTTHIDPGVWASHAYVAEVSLPLDMEKALWQGAKSGNTAKENQELNGTNNRRFQALQGGIISTITNRLRNEQGVQQVGVISAAPYSGHNAETGSIQGAATPDIQDSDKASHDAVTRSIDSGAIPTLGMRLIAGRNYTGNASEDNKTAIVNEAMARELGQGSSVLGTYLKDKNTWLRHPTAQIVGIVANVHATNIYSKVLPTVYFPFSEYGVPDFNLVVRTAPGVPELDVRRFINTAVHSVSPDATVSHFAPLSEMVESASTLSRYSAYYLLTLAFVSLFLVGICVSGNTQSEFKRREREIGIRMAFGATRENIIRLFVSANLLRTGAGALVGALLAWWFARLFRHILYGVQLFDVTSYAIGIAALIGLTAMVQILLLRTALKKNPRYLM